LAIACALAGCGPRAETASDSAETVGESPGDVEGTNATNSSDAGMSSAPGSSDTGSTGRAPRCEPISDDPALACDPSAQDCPPDEKCMPWANDGGSAWNALRCVPVVAAPRTVGETCAVVGSGVSGEDDCDLGLMCWDVDPRTNLGTCLALCGGCSDAPTCAPACTSCVVGNWGVLPLCMPTCDPVAQDCRDGTACGALPEGPTFCYPSVPERIGIAGDPCRYSNSCDPGFTCVEATAFPGCVGTVGCCSPWCDDAEDCSELPGTTCVSWALPRDLLGCIAETFGVCRSAP
jgi:hypothetical protein